MHLQNRRVPQFGAAGVGFVGQPGQQPRMAAHAFHDPRQRRRRRLVTGHQQGQQLVGDVPVRHRLAVAAAGPQQQRQHVVAPAGREIGTRVRDERPDHGVELAPVPRKPPTGAPPAVVAPYRRRQQADTRTDPHRRRYQLAEPVERGALGVEHRTPCDASHRGQRRELPALRPVRALAHHLFVDGLLVGPYPLAVQRRSQQSAALDERLPVQAPCRSGTDHLAEGVPGPPEHIDAGAEQFLDQDGVAHHDRPAEYRQLHGKRAAVPAAEPPDDLLPRGQESDPLQCGR